MTPSALPGGPGGAQSRHSETGGSVSPRGRWRGWTLPQGTLSRLGPLPTTTERCQPAPPRAPRWQSRRKAGGQSRSTGRGKATELVPRTATAPRHQQNPLFGGHRHRLLPAPWSEAGRPPPQQLGWTEPSAASRRGDSGPQTTRGGGRHHPHGSGCRQAQKGHRETQTEPGLPTTEPCAWSQQ